MSTLNELSACKMHEHDVGSESYQAVCLALKVYNLSKNHFDEHKKDLHSKRGFLAKINRQKRLLKYLKMHHMEQYEKTMKLIEKIKKGEFSHI